MPEASYQTIRLSKGKHSSPDDGACVIELASMLAGEPFSDHPRSVSPPIAAFLRGYNDLLDGERRQDLYPYAAKVVGTAASPEVEDARTRHLLSWGDELRGQGSPLRRLTRPRFCHSRRRKTGQANPDQAAAYALHSIAKLSNNRHAAALALVDELVVLGRPPDLDVLAAPTVQAAGSEPLMTSP